MMLDKDYIERGWWGRGHDRCNSGLSSMVSRFPGTSGIVKCEPGTPAITAKQR